MSSISSLGLERNWTRSRARTVRSRVVNRSLRTSWGKATSEVRFARSSSGALLSLIASLRFTEQQPPEAGVLGRTAISIEKFALVIHIRKRNCLNSFSKLINISLSAFDTGERNRFIVQPDSASWPALMQLNPNVHHRFLCFTNAYGIALFRCAIRHSAL